MAKAEDLVGRYDADGNGTIEKGEVIQAIKDYLFGEGDEAISKGDVIRLIKLYLFGPSTPHNRPGALAECRAALTLVRYDEPSGWPYRTHMRLRAVLIQADQHYRPC